MNSAFMAKLGWRILTENGALWVQVLRNKYVRHDDFVLSDIKKITEVSKACGGKRYSVSCGQWTEGAVLGS